MEANTTDDDQEVGEETCGGDIFLSFAPAQLDEATKDEDWNFLFLVLFRSANKTEIMTDYSQNMMAFASSLKEGDVQLRHISQR